MIKDSAKPYISRLELAQICQNLGKKISEDYKDKELILICILKGSIVFTADLARHITLPLEIDFVRLSSYGNEKKSSGVVRITKDISVNIEGKDVLLVEDILDTGNTLHFFCNHLRASKPRSLKICTLLEKPSRREKEIFADYCGRKIEDHFVVGYGLDVAEHCRNYKDILWVDS